MAKKDRRKSDPVLLSLIFILIAMGVSILFSVSARISQQKFGNTYYFLGHQILMGIIPGVILGLVFLNVELKTLKKWSLYVLLANICLLLLIFVPNVGLSIGGARRWLSIGTISFQPAEFLKVSLPLYLSAWLAKKKKGSLATLGYFFLILLPIMLSLILQPDISTLGIIILTSFLLYFLSGTPVWHTFLMIGMGLAGLMVLVNTTAYRIKRFLVFMNPNIEPLGIGYQINQAAITIGSGGLFGKGLGMSRQKFGLLPNVMSDSVFAIFCEETGLIGPLLLISLFLLFLIRAIRIGLKARSDFERLLCSTLVVGIVSQAFLNMGAMIGIIPLTGTPLPFISYGGTHLVVELISVGIILNISRQK